MLCSLIYVVWFTFTNMSNFFNLEEEPEFPGSRNDGRGYQNVFNAPALPSNSHRGLEDSPILSSAGTSSNASSSSDNEGELNLVAARKLPLRGIKKPDSNNDCLFGRGGGTNTHPGNKKVCSYFNYTITHLSTYSLI